MKVLLLVPLCQVLASVSFLPARVAVPTAWYDTINAQVSTASDFSASRTTLLNQPPALLSKVTNGNTRNEQGQRADQQSRICRLLNHRRAQSSVLRIQVVQGVPIHHRLCPFWNCDTANPSNDPYESGWRDASCFIYHCCSVWCLRWLALRASYKLGILSLVRFSAWLYPCLSCILFVDQCRTEL